MDEYDPKRVEGKFNVAELFKINFFGWGPQGSTTREYSGLIQEAGPGTCDASYLMGVRDFLMVNPTPQSEEYNNECYALGFKDAQKFCIKELREGLRPSNPF